MTVASLCVAVRYRTWARERKRRSICEPAAGLSMRQKGGPFITGYTMTPECLVDGIRYLALWKGIEQFYRVLLVAESFSMIKDPPRYG